MSMQIRHKYLSYPADYLLGYDRLCKHHGAIVLLAPSDSVQPLEVFDQKYLVEYIPLERYGYQQLKHDFLPMA
jgi:hypothetical protein